MNNIRFVWKLSRVAGFVAISILLLGPVALRGQEITGRILGSVLDSSGAAVPNAQITITNQDTGVARNTVSGSDGLYNVPQVVPGTYSVEAVAQGFSPVQVKDVSVTVGTDSRIDLKVQVGSVSQTVSVTEAVPLVDTTSSSIGGTVDEQRVAELPLNGRNWTDLTLLQPGVTQAKVMMGTPGTAGFNGTMYSSNGAPIMSNAISLDGANLKNLIGFNNSSMTNTSLGVDGIKEYKVVTNVFSAEYGLSMGSQTTVVSKGGTNRFHGDAFEYLRNSSLDARNYFDALDTANVNGFGTGKSLSFPGKRIPPFRRNNFGGSFGGPIRKDKTFFYAVYEGVRQQLGVTIANLKTFPSACFVDPAGVTHAKIPAQIANTGGACSGTAGQINVNPIVLPLADLFPKPNATGYPAFNYTFPFTQPTSENYGQIRIDQSFSASDSAFFRWTQDDATEVSNRGFAAYLESLGSFARFATVGENHVFSPTVLNTARFSVSRTDTSLLNDIDTSGPNGPGSLILVEGIKDQVMGGVSPGGGVSTIGGSGSTQPGLIQTLYTASDDVFWTKGKHAFKFGTLVNYFYDDPEHIFDQPGSVSFATLTNFFTADYSSLVEFSPFSFGISTDFRYITAGFYAQDDYRVTNRLTLNLGLRYEFNTVPIEPDPFLYYSLRSPSDSIGTFGGMMRNPSLHNFSPRIGFAWDPFGKGQTSIRGGAGIYYDIGNYGGFMLSNGDGTPPASLIITITNTAPTPAVPLTIPFPANLSSTQVPTPRGVYYNLGQPTLFQHSLEIDQQLPWQMGLSIGYVGSRGWHLVQEEEANFLVPVGTDQYGLPIYGCWNAAQTAHQPTGANGACPTGFTSTGPRINPNLGQSTFSKDEGEAYYNSLQVQLNKRISRGLQFQFSYTYSKLLDTGQQNNPGNSTENIQAPFNETDDRGPAVFDSTHNVRFNMIYHAPNLQSDKLVGKLLNGWWFASIVSGQSGYPFQPTTTLDRELQNAAQVTERLNLDPSFSAHGDIENNATQWFNPTEFDLQPAGRMGNAGRGILRGPGFENVDFSAVKDTKVGFLGEAGSVEFRAEVFNLLNHPNFAVPNSTVYAGVGTATAATAPSGQIGSTAALAPFASAGQITGTVSNSRQIQFALKLIF